MTSLKRKRRNEVRRPRAPTTRTLQMLVTVRIPREMTAIQARREVRCLITEQCNYAAEPDDVRAVSVRPAPRA